jgi:hypothetical protein
MRTAAGGGGRRATVTPVDNPQPPVKMPRADTQARDGGAVLIARGANGQRSAGMSDAEILEKFPAG